jgi:hypothetical protein
MKEAAGLFATFIALAHFRHAREPATPVNSPDFGTIDPTLQVALLKARNSALENENAILKAENTQLQMQFADITLLIRRLIKRLLENHKKLLEGSSLRQAPVDPVLAAKIAEFRVMDASLTTSVIPASLQAGSICKNPVRQDLTDSSPYCRHHDLLAN